MPWVVTSPRDKYRLPADSPTPAYSSPLPDVAGPNMITAAQLNPLHPHSPMFWFGVLTFTTFGLMAVSGRGGGSFRFGPFHASADASAGAGKAKNE